MNPNATPRSFTGFPRNTREAHRKSLLDAGRQERIAAEQDRRRRVEEDYAYRQHVPTQIREADTMIGGEWISRETELDFELFRAAEELGIRLS